MARTLNVLIVEDDTETCAKFAHYADNAPNIDIVGITNNSFRAIDIVRELQPDAIILDLELNDGEGNGLLFLEDMKKVDILFKPYVLVTTNNTSSTNYDFARENGADFIMFKQQDGYTEQEPINFLNMMKDIILHNITKQHSSYSTTESPIQYQKRLRNRIARELDNIGISPKSNGYQYLIDAIILAINGRNNNICIELGKMYSKTSSSIERASQNAINRAWKSENINTLLEHYTAKIHSAKGVPSLNEFVFYYANKIKNGY